jgi:hypothetical protein
VAYLVAVVVMYLINPQHEAMRLGITGQTKWAVP